MDDEKLMQVARRMAAKYDNPDALYVSGEPFRVSVPGGFGYVIDLGRAVPLWTAYLALAKEALDANKE